MQLTQLDAKPQSLSHFPRRPCYLVPFVKLNSCLSSRWLNLEHLRKLIDYTKNYIWVQSEWNWNMSTSNIPNIWYQSNETEYQWIEIKSWSLKCGLGWVTTCGTRLGRPYGWSNQTIYLFKLSNDICPYYKMYLSELLDVFCSNRLGWVTSSGSRSKRPYGWSTGWSQGRLLNRSQSRFKLEDSNALWLVVL